MQDRKMMSAAEKAILDAELRRVEEARHRYPTDVPNAVCRHAFLRGFCVENSINPEVGDYSSFCRIGNERIFVWTYRKNEYSALVSETDAAVKQLCYWKTAGDLIWLSWAFSCSFEKVLLADRPGYGWMYYFDPSVSDVDSVVFYGLSDIERITISAGIQIKLTTIAELAPIIELLIRDDRAYTALSILHSAFCVHPFCLHCEMNEKPILNHLSEEPEMWEQTYRLPALEMAVVQACRAVEAILGEPPNQRKQGKAIQHKQRWKEKVGIDPDELFEKADMTYFAFYYNLFFHLRNASAHSYGDVHFDLARKQAIEAQCFAMLVVQKYFEKHVCTYDKALDILEFNRELLARVDEQMIVRGTADPE